MKNNMISAKKVSLSSEYNYFDLLPVKKYQQCSIRIPETVLLEKGYIKDWVFNSHKIATHPILKKKKENLIPYAVVKSFCYKFGYGAQIQGCSNIKEIKEAVQGAMKDQKDYDYIKNKKAIEVTTVSNEVLVMTLLDFLDYASQNKYNQQVFYERWKLIQEKVSFTKIDESYKVENFRNNHIIESKCQKIISINTAETGIHSMQLEDDPFKNSSPNKNMQVSQTKNLQGYKFFDTFLNKKFFTMSQELIEFIEKNLKCIVQSVVTKFVINKEREPYLAGISELEIKPAKKIADSKQFQSAKSKGFIKIEEYLKLLETYLRQNHDKSEGLSIHTPLGQIRGKCKGRLCKIPLEDTGLPSILTQKVSLPYILAANRLISGELRDAVSKRKRRVLEKLIQNKIIDEFQIEDESSEYESEGEKQESTLKSKNKQIKVCQNCYAVYFHINKFFDCDMYGNLVEKKLPPSSAQTISEKKEINRYSSDKILSLGKSEIKKQRDQKRQSADRKLDSLAERFIHSKMKDQQGYVDIRPITSNLNTSSSKNLSNLKLHQERSHLNDLGIRKTKVNSFEKQRGSSKSILNPIGPTKQEILERSLANQGETKANRLLALSKLNQSSKFQNKAKSKTFNKTNFQQKQKRPQSFNEASEVVLKKLALLSDSSPQQFMYCSKKYYLDNLPQPIERVSYSSYYQSHLYEFMSISPVSIHPKRRIKKKPEMSLKRLSELTEYPEIVSRSQFVFDTIIINQQTTIPFCVLTTNVVNPENIKQNQPFQNIFFINDIFDSFIEHISMAKQLLEEDEMFNKRIILFNYPGQSHTIYNKNNTQGNSAVFCEALDKLVFRLSGEQQQLGIIDLEKDSFKFFAFGYGGFLLMNYLGTFCETFGERIRSVLLCNSFPRFPNKYKQVIRSLYDLYSSNDPTIEPQAHLYYNKIIFSSETNQQEIQRKCNLNPIRVQDRVYILECIINQIMCSETTSDFSIQADYFMDNLHFPVSVIYAKSNEVVDREICMEIAKGFGNKGDFKGREDIQNRVFIQIDGGHDIFADNYVDIFRVLAIMCTK